MDEVRKLINGLANDASDDVNAAEGEKVEIESEEDETKSQEFGKPKPSDPSAGANEDETPAEVAAEVADSAEKLDQGK